MVFSVVSNGMIQFMFCVQNNVDNIFSKGLVGSAFHYAATRDENSQ